ncbi:hypothetical protein JW930_04925 [Candidatus Woesearchaeota archaeon]|nr:hypothetical protein [Candidatus Woesearchaeota archaeon]
MKKKHLLPTLNNKKRYIVFEAVSENKINEADIYETIKNSCHKVLGSLDKAKANIRFLKNRFNKKDRRGIIRVNHRYIDKLRLSLALVTHINDTKVIIKCVGVSGILKKAVSNYL